MQASTVKTSPKREPVPGWEMLIHAGAGKAFRFRAPSLILFTFSAFALVFFSIADFREAAYKRREKDLQSRFQNNQEELGAFSLWLIDKEQELDRYLAMTGEKPEDEPDFQTLAASPNPSYDGVRKSIERIENRIRILADFQMRDEEYFWNVSSIAPVNLTEDFSLTTHLTNNVIKNGLSGISSFQGIRMHPLNGKEEMHHGIDFFCPIGTKVRAPANGTVTFVGRFDPNQDNIRQSYGNFIVIRHGDTGIETKFAHLDSIHVVKGELVKRGDIIALTGNSGSSTGPHLHYEVNRNGVSLNPLNYITDVPLVEGGKKIFYVKNKKPVEKKKKRKS